MNKTEEDSEVLVSTNDLLDRLLSERVERVRAEVQRDQAQHDLARIRTELGNKNIEIARLRSQEGEKKTDLEEDNEEVGMQEIINNLIAQSLDLLVSECREHGRAGAQRDHAQDELARVRNELENKDMKIARLRSQVDKKDIEIERLHAQLVLTQTDGNFRNSLLHPR